MKANTITIKIMGSGNKAVKSYELPMKKEEFIVSLAEKFPKLVNINKTLTNMRIYPQYLYAKSEECRQFDFISVPVQDISYIEEGKDQCLIYSKNQNVYSSYMSLNELSEYLPSNKYCRIDKRCIINASQIKRITGNVITMQNSDTLEMGDDFYSELNQQFKFLG